MRRVWARHDAEYPDSTISTCISFTAVPWWVDQYVETLEGAGNPTGSERDPGRRRFESPSRASVRLIDETGKTPAINQLEVHPPSFSQTETLKFCKEHGIVVEAYSPLGTVLI